PTPPTAPAGPGLRWARPGTPGPAAPPARSPSPGAGVAHRRAGAPRSVRTVPARGSRSGPPRCAAGHTYAPRAAATPLHAPSPEDRRPGSSPRPADATAPAARPDPYPAPAPAPNRHAGDLRRWTSPWIYRPRWGPVRR